MGDCTLFGLFSNLTELFHHRASLFMVETTLSPHTAVKLVRLFVQTESALFWKGFKLIINISHERRIGFVGRHYYYDMLRVSPCPMRLLTSNDHGASLFAIDYRRHEAPTQ